MSITDRALRMIMVANIFSTATEMDATEEVQDAVNTIAVKHSAGTKTGVCGSPVAK